MVKCSECGFLALRNRETGQLIEADSEYRKYGKPIYRVTNDIENYPLCLMRLYDLEVEEEALASEQIDLVMADKGDSRDWPSYILQVINKERQCDNYRKWQQGFTPKEHREMIDREGLLKYQENQRKEDRKWHNEQQVRLVVIAGIFTIIGALIGASITLIR